MEKIGPFDFATNAPTYGNDAFADWENADPATSQEGSSPPAEFPVHVMSELVHLIEQAGLVPGKGDLTQVFQAVRAFKDIYYCTDDSQAADAVLLTTASKGAPAALRDGLVVVWRNKTTNTGPATLKLDATPARGLTVDFAAMAAGEIVANRLCFAVYDADNTAWRVPSWASQVQPEASPASVPRSPNLPQLEAVADGSQLVPSNSETAIAFQTTQKNNFVTSTWDGTTFTVGAGEAGAYTIVGGARFNGTGTGLSTRIFRNAGIIAQMVLGGTGSANHGHTLPAKRRLAVGDTIQIRSSQSTGGSQAAVANESSISITRDSV
ncbi:hypothetical protein [Pyruvatibacter sp.]